MSKVWIVEQFNTGVDRVFSSKKKAVEYIKQYSPYEKDNLFYSSQEDIDQSNDWEFCLTDREVF